MKSIFSGQERKLIVNLITVSRFPITLLAIYLFQSNKLFPALFVFLVAALTDAIDGYLARKWEATSTFGKSLDPIIDKLSVFSLFIVIIISIWNKLPNIPTNRTFLVLGVILFGMLAIVEIEIIWLGSSAWRKIRKGGDLELEKELGSNIFGKTKMGLEILTIIVLLFFLEMPKSLFLIIALLALFLAVISALLSLRKYLLDHEEIEDKLLINLQKITLFKKYEELILQKTKNKKSAEE